MVNLALSWRHGRLPRPGTAIGRHLLRVAHKCGEAIARHLRNRRGERQLAKMSDYERHDLGITRGDVHRVAWQGED